MSNLQRRKPASENYNSCNADKFVLRLPEGMRERIAEEARNNHRSMNSEMINRLQASLEPGGYAPNEPAATGDWQPALGQVVKGPFGIGMLKEFHIQEGELLARVDGHGVYRITALRPYLV